MIAVGWMKPGPAGLRQLSACRTKHVELYKLGILPWWSATASRSPEASAYGPSLRTRREPTILSMRTGCRDDPLA